jgi:DNA-binding transcriptional ArsR family regulator
MVASDMATRASDKIVLRWWITQSSVVEPFSQEILCNAHDEATRMHQASAHSLDTRELLARCQLGHARARSLKSASHPARSNKHMKTTSQARLEAEQGSIDHDLVKAMAHPLRYELLLKLNGRSASPNELSKEVKASVGTVNYHIRLLEQMGFVELVEQKKRRGATEHFYRATQRAWFSKSGWARLPIAVRRSIAGVTLDSIWGTVKRAAVANAFDDPDVHVTSTALELDDKAYANVCEVLSGALQRVLDIQADCLTRRATTRSTQLVLMHFDRG